MVRVNQIALSRAGRCSGGGHACGGRQSDVLGGWSGHCRTGTFICSGGDRIGLGTLTQSFARGIGIGITVITALAFNGADGLLSGVSNGWTRFPLWAFTSPHGSKCYGPNLLSWIEVVPFGQRLASCCRGDRCIETVFDRSEGLEIGLISGCVIAYSDELLIQLVDIL